MFPGINEGHCAEMSISWCQRQDRKDLSIYFTDHLKVLMAQSTPQAILWFRNIIVMVGFSNPTPQIPPPRSFDPAHCPAAGWESKEMNKVGSQKSKSCP